MDWRMEKLRTTIGNWFDRLDTQWRAMPVKKQHRYTLLLFAGYALLSVIVLLKVCYDLAQSDSTIVIEHIENPVIRQDSTETILKQQNHERE